MYKKFKSIIFDYKIFVITAISIIVAAALFSLYFSNITSNKAYAEDNNTNNQTTQNTTDPTKLYKTAKILFTADIHSYFTSTHDINDGVLEEHGNSARLATVINNLRSQNSIYVDAGDITSGTLIESEFKEKAEELKILGQLGCEVTTWGNHEFDYSGYGLADMLNNATELRNTKGIHFPQYVQSNIDFSGELSDEQEALKSACNNFGVKRYVIKDMNGLKIAFFGLEGPDSIECSPTNEQKWVDYKEAAKNIVDEIGDRADIKVCLSHSESSKDTRVGEDAELAKAVPGIDVIISGHAHNLDQEAIKVNDTYIVSAGSYLYNVGEIDVGLNSSNKAVFKKFKLHRLDESIPEDPDMLENLSNIKEEINNGYLAKYSPDCKYGTVLGECPFDFYGTDEMESSTKELPIGNLIADSYRYKASSCGVNDIDICAVGYGTIRDGFHSGNITTNDVYKVCPLGVGSDNSSGHPLIISYFYGSEIRMLAQLETSLGGIKNSIKMSYSGLNLTYNKNRMILDKITNIELVDNNGNTKELEDDKLYKVCLNAYAMNMLGMVNNITHGIITITAKNADGSPLEDYYQNTLIDNSGQEVKEWIALKDYVKELKVIPEKYDGRPDRKIQENEGGLSVIANPGMPTIVAIILIILFTVLTIFIIKKLIKLAIKISKIIKSKYVNRR